MSAVIICFGCGCVLGFAATAPEIAIMCTNCTCAQTTLFEALTTKERDCLICKPVSDLINAHKTNYPRLYDKVNMLISDWRL